jgi:hypothetical protein
MNSIVSGASLVSAVATATAVEALSGASSAPSVAMIDQLGADAELLTLSAKFEAAWNEVREACDNFNDLNAEVHAAAEELCPNLPEDQREWSRDDGNRYWQAFCEASNEPHEAAEDALNTADEVCDTLARAMARIEPCTIAGAGARARVSMCAASHWWDKSLDDLEWPEMHSRLLIEALCAAAGLPTHPDSAYSHAASALSAEPDPTFAAINAYQSAWTELLQKGPALEEAEAAGRAEATPIADELHDRALNTRVALMEQTIPTSLAGAVAILRYIADANTSWDPDQLCRTCANLAGALPTLAA